MALILLRIYFLSSARGWEGDSLLVLLLAYPPPQVKENDPKNCFFPKVSGLLPDWVWEAVHLLHSCADLCQLLAPGNWLLFCSQQWVSCLAWQYLGSRWCPRQPAVLAFEVWLLSGLVRWWPSVWSHTHKCHRKERTRGEPSGKQVS